MKTEPTYQKLRGGYYTPQPIAQFLARWAIQSPTAVVLEPSCGDGNLLVAAAETLMKLGASPESVAGLLLGVELDQHEADKAVKRLQALGVPIVSNNSSEDGFNNPLTPQPPNNPPAPLWKGESFGKGDVNHVQVGDFFAHCQRELFGEKLFNTVLKERKRFDAVIGNPPFIRYQNFPEEHQKIAFQLMRQAGLNPNRLTNSWLPFLVVGSLLLKENGRLAMVVPAELFQVNYAAEVRQFLSEFYDRITLVTFKRLLFDGIQQEVVLLLGERNKYKNGGIRSIELNGVEALASLTETNLDVIELKPIDHSTEKWTQYFLKADEIELLRSLLTLSQLTLSGKVLDVDVGIVTGRNEFFILTQRQVKKHSLEPYLERVVSRSGHLHGAIFSAADFLTNVQEQLPAFLFMPPDEPLEQLPQPVQNYILGGEAKGVHKGYKCRIREKWYIAPSVWIPDAFMLRQVHAYPKLILNDAQATCTDTIHRVRLKNGVGGKVVTAAFLNSLTFAFAEVTGRSYGGGVLTFEPSEAESLPLPLTGAEQLDLNHICNLLRDDDIDGVLDITDRTLLIEGLGLGAEQVRMLRGIWAKLRDRRINRKHKRKKVEYPIPQESLEPPKHETVVEYQPLLGGFDEE